MRISKPGMAAALGLLALLCIFFPRVIFLGEVFLFTEPMATDIVRLNLPLRCFLERSLANGVFPLWSPEIYCGFPIHAWGEGGFCHPVSLLASLLFSAPRALVAATLFGFVAAFLFVLLYGRRIRLSWPAAFLSASSFAFSAYVVQEIQHTNILLALSFMGLVFYGWERYCQSDVLGWVALAGAGWAFQILAGYPGVAYNTALVIAAYAVYGSWSRKGTVSLRMRTCVGSLTVFFVIGLALSAVQWMPTWELTQRSLRAAGLPFERAVEFHYHWKDLLIWISPVWADDPSRSLAAFDRDVEVWENASYIGLIPLGLALFALLSGLKKKGHHRFFSGLLLVCMALVLETPLYKLCWTFLPGFKFFRVPAKWLLPAIFSAALLAGIGLDWLRKEFPKKHAAVWISLLLGLSLVDLWAYSGSRYVTVPPAFWLKAPTVIPLTKNSMTRTVSYKTWDLFSAINRELVARGEESRALSLESYRLYKEMLGPGAELTWGLLGSWSRCAALPLQSLTTLLAASDLSMENHRLLLSAPTAQMLRLQAIQFVVAPWPIVSSEFESVKRFDPTPGSLPVFLHSLKKPLLRAYVVGERVVIPDPSRFVQEVLSSHLDPSRVVALEVPSPSGDASARGSAVSWEKDDSDRLGMKVDMQGNGYLVLSDTYYPGWHATVDGEKADILRANGNFRAVWLSRGVHEVTFFYKPLSFQIGLAISCLSALGLAFYLANLRRLRPDRLKLSQALD